MEILCTLGPSSLNKFTLKKLEDIGVNLFRINLSHTELKDLKNLIFFIQKNSSVPICIDTEGAQIRTRLKKELKLSSNQEFNIYFDFKNKPQKLNLYPYEVLNQLEVGDLIYIDFNSVIVEVINISKDLIRVFVINGGMVGSNKGVAVNKKLKLSSLTEKDIKAIKISQKIGIRNYALSFCSQREDVLNLKKLLEKKCRIISKIENIRGFENCNEIAKSTDALLIDRGDLSREFKIEDIPIVQKKIINISKKNKKKVYVATNFLESMLINPFPNRAEINDIYNTLLDGANGLVLAAETAIGKFPIQSASIIRRVYNNFKNIVNVKNPSNKNNSKKINLKFEKLLVDSYAESDIKQMLLGTFSPVNKFMNLQEIRFILKNNKLKNGFPWALPIVLPINTTINTNLKRNNVYEIFNKKRNCLCYMKIEDIFKIEDERIFKDWFSCNDSDHPGILSLKSRGKTYISGKLIKKHSKSFIMRPFEGSPKKINELIYSKGWKTVVGFHTRNIPHQAHIFIQKRALEKVNADGLLLSPMIGEKEKGDFSNDLLIESYKGLLKSNVHKNLALLGFLDIYPRYAGPREAIFSAQCRKNLGCTHFIIGRDHAGISNYYNDISTRKFLKKFKNIGIELIFFNSVGYDMINKKYIFDNGRINPISGSYLRELIKSKKKIPPYLLDKHQQNIITNWKKKFFY